MKHTKRKLTAVLVFAGATLTLVGTASASDVPLSAPLTSGHLVNTGEPVPHSRGATTVSGLRVDPHKEIRILHKRSKSSTVYYDGIVRKVERVNATTDQWAVTLYRPTYKNEHIYYVWGTDEVTAPTRHVNHSNEQVDNQRLHERSMWTSAD
ncbi:hypothetical protein [Streptomyces sp. NPDC017993]|uniref:hypothetical protein n=1 Tax=Streptomyces sp. NPDC017993 TaxID=3365027 RepID=UPI0037BB4FDB